MAAINSDISATTVNDSDTSEDRGVSDRIPSPSDEEDEEDEIGMPNRSRGLDLSRLSAPQLRNAYTKLDDKFRDIKNRRTVERKQIQRLKDEKTSLKEELKEVHLRLERLQQDIKSEKQQHKEALQERETSFAKAERQFAEMIKISSNIRIPDDVVRSEFATIQREVLSWAKNWASSDVHSRDTNQLQGLLAGWIAGTPVDGVKQIQQQFQGWSTSTRAILAAQVLHTVITKMFECPFRFLAFYGYRENTICACKDIHKVIETEDHSKAIAWRAETVSLLSSAQATTETHRREIASIAQHIFGICKGDASLLRDVSTEQGQARSNELCYIIQKTYKLASKIWTQRTDVHIMTTEILQSQFDVHSPLYMAHSSMGLDEDDDQSFNGKSVDFVICPAVVAFGNSDGLNYDQRKVWAKAIVKVFEEKQDERELENPVHPIPKPPSRVNRFSPWKTEEERKEFFRQARS